MSFPADYNFPYYIGDTKYFVLYPKNRSGSPYDLTGFESRFVISNEIAANPAWSVDGEAVLNATDSTISCTIPPSVGNQLVSSNRYYYDIEIRKTENGKDIVFTLLKGVITPVIGVNRHV